MLHVILPSPENYILCPPLGYCNSLPKLILLSQLPSFIYHLQSTTKSDITPIVLYGHSLSTFKIKNHWQSNHIVFVIHCIPYVPFYLSPSQKKNPLVSYNIIILNDILQIFYKNVQKKNLLQFFLMFYIFVCLHFSKTVHFEWG